MSSQFYSLLVFALLFIGMSWYAVRRNRILSEQLGARLAAETEAHYRELMADLKAAAGPPFVPPDPKLVVTLELTDAAAVLSPAALAATTERWLSSLSRAEQSLGGRGLTLAGVRSGPGQVTLTLAPEDRAGAADRLTRVAETATHDPAEAGGVSGIGAEVCGV